MGGDFAYKVIGLSKLIRGKVVVMTKSCKIVCSIHLIVGCTDIFLATLLCEDVALMSTLGE